LLIREPSAPRHARAELVVRTGPVAGLRFALREGVIVVGRSSRSDCPLHDPAVSRRHFELKVTPDSVRLRDLGSGNGTRLNGHAVDTALLQHGDRILAGNSTLEFCLASSSSLDGRDTVSAPRVPRRARWERPMVAVGLAVLAAITVVSTLAAHRRNLRRSLAQAAFDRGLAELAQDPPDPELALADFEAAAPDALDRRALRDAVATAQGMTRAIQQLALARQLAEGKDFVEARRQLQGLPSGSYFDRMAASIAREIDEREAAQQAERRRPVPVIRILEATSDPPTGARPSPRPHGSAARARKAGAVSAARNDDDRAEQLCDDADALLARNPEAAREKYRKALEVARPGGAAALRAQGGLGN
jgi:pSer/pThr/pTyr-binding forkhead associated (FHA) protein